MQKYGLFLIYKIFGDYFYRDLTMWFNNLVNAKVRIIFNIQNIWRLFFKFSLFHWLYTQNGINLFSLRQHFKNQKNTPNLDFWE